MSEHIKTYIDVLDNDIKNIILGYLKDYEDDIEIIDDYSKLTSNDKIQIFVIDSDNADGNFFDNIKKIKSIYPEAQILLIASKFSTDFSLSAMRIGVDEIIKKPLIKSDFLNLIDLQIKKINGSLKNISKCKIISTFSNKGGIGKTAIAVNLGVELADLTKEKVAIIDLNLQLGDVTTFLDLNPTFNISYLVENFDKINSDFLISTLQQYKNTSLYVLAEPTFAEQANDISKEQIMALLEKMKETFSYIIIDTGSNFDDKTIGALDKSDMILLCTIVNLPAIRSCQRCLDLFSRFGYNEEKIKIILNRYMDNDEIKPYDVEKVLNKKVWWKIPNNYITMISSLNKGLPVKLVNSDANISQNFQELASKLADGLEFINIEKSYKEEI